MSRAEIAVIGTVFTDIKGFAASSYQPYGRNLGRVELFQGGVGRNIAENMANLGVGVRFVSSVDDGMLGSGVLDRLISAGVDSRYIAKAPQRGMGIWMLINDETGGQAGSLSQLADPAHIEGQLERFGDEIFSTAEHIALEVDISERINVKTLELARKHHKKIYALPASMAIVMKTPWIFSELECFICNHIEAGRLFGTDMESLDDAEMFEALRQGMKACGLRSMVATLGARGAVYCDARTGLCGAVPAMNVNVTDTSGAGDAFFSGTTAALLRGIPLEEAVRRGTKLAAMTIQVTSCTCDPETVRSAKLL